MLLAPSQLRMSSPACSGGRISACGSGFGLGGRGRRGERTPKCLQHGPIAWSFDKHRDPGKQRAHDRAVEPALVLLPHRLRDGRAQQPRPGSARALVEEQEVVDQKRARDLGRVGDDEDLAAALGDPGQHARNLRLPKRLQCFLGLLEASDRRLPGGFRKAQQNRDQQQALRAATLPRHRDLNFAAGHGQTQRLQQLAQRDRSRLKLRQLFRREQAQQPKVLGERCKLPLDPRVCVDGGGTTLERRLKRIHGWLEVDVAEQALQQAALVEGKLPGRIAGTTVEHPADFRPEPGRKAGTVGLLLRELVEEVEILGAAHAHPHDRFHILAVRLSNELFRRRLPSLQVAPHLRDIGGRQLTEDRFDREARLRAAGEIVDLCRLRALTAKACVQQQIEALQHRALAGVVRSQDHRPRPRRERQRLQASEALDGETADAHLQQTCTRAASWQRSTRPIRAGLRRGRPAPTAPNGSPLFSVILIVSER